MKSTPANIGSVQEHIVNMAAILEAIQDSQPGGTPENVQKILAEHLPVDKLKHYQHHLCERFGAVIEKPSYVYLSKTAGSWLVVGDRRSEVASDILLITERFGLGIGLLVLHLQQIRARHILAQVEVDGCLQDLSQPTECLRGAHGELVLSIPIRKYRGDFSRLAALNILKPKDLWVPDKIVTHERDRYPCFYCSCNEINPAEVVLDLEGWRHGLSRHYSMGFTFAPFGNPLTTVHFLAWDRARKPLNMNRTPMTVSDLVKLTREVNVSIREYFSEIDIGDYPVIDALSNGWAGNTIYHQHFQFFSPEHPSPITHAKSDGKPPVICRDDVTVQRLQWPAPIYRIAAEDALNTGLVGNDLAGIWRLIGGSRKVNYKQFRDGYVPHESDKIHVHTQNLYVPGRDLGATAYIVLRDRERVDYKPAKPSKPTLSHAVDTAGKPSKVSKENIGVLEATGTLITDSASAFEELKQCPPEDISRQVSEMIASIAPEDQKVREFETAIQDLFPQ